MPLESRSERRERDEENKAREKKEKVGHSREVTHTEGLQRPIELSDAEATDDFGKNHFSGETGLELQKERVDEQKTGKRSREGKDWWVAVLRTEGGRCQREQRGSGKLLKVIKVINMFFSF